MDNPSAISFLQSESKQLRHTILLYGRLGSFRTFYSEYAKMLLEADKAVVMCPSIEESVESVLSELGKQGIDVIGYTKSEALTVLRGVKEYFGENGKIVNYITSLARSLEAQGKNGICIIIDYSGLYYQTYDERFFPMKSDHVLDRVIIDHNIAMLCCFKEEDFREQYSCMMKEAMVNSHDGVIELNCRHFH